MLIFNFSRIFKLRGIERPFSFLVNNGYSPSFATKIARSQVPKLNLKYVEKLCILFNCTPNDLLDFIPNDKNKIPANHPLIALKRGDDYTRLSEIINSIPVDKIDEVEKIISKLKNNEEGQQQ